ncbi:MAG: hypothetical protein KME06_03025 [Kastovskya adunca ATA6-11-RM4]|nr:hypothetical protein [Kastovskya adunca ATA6-11-RM4]
MFSTGLGDRVLSLAALSLETQDKTAEAGSERYIAKRDRTKNLRKLIN